MMPRTLRRFDLSDLDLRKRSAPIGRKEKLHERMERELTNLKRDRRFWEGDKAYQRYVQRQFERVYNDPTGKRQPLRIGPPKIFATDIEPFESETKQSNLSHQPDHKPRVRSSSEGSSQKKLGNPDSSESTQGVRQVRRDQDPEIARKVGKQQRVIIDRRTDKFREQGKLAKALDLAEVEFAGGDTPLEQAQASSVVMVGKFVEYGWDTANLLFEHYLNGGGDQVTIPADVVIDYPTLPSAHRRVLWNFGRWLVGDIEDSRFGKAPLPQSDGERTVIGGPLGEGALPLDDLVMWESTFRGVGETTSVIDKLALDDEAHSSIGGGTLQGFAANLTLTREGDTIRVSGTLEFRVEDIYKFDDGHWLHYDELEKAGLATRFTVVSTPWSRKITGAIHLDGDEPVSVVMGVVGEPQLRVQFPGSPDSVNPRSIQSLQ